jgi:hypothetical protein
MRKESLLSIEQLRFLNYTSFGSPPHELSTEEVATLIGTSDRFTTVQYRFRLYCSLCSANEFDAGLCFISSNTAAM